MITKEDIKVLKEKKIVKIFNGMALRNQLMTIKDDDNIAYGEITTGIPTGTTFYIEMDDKQTVSVNISMILEYIVNNIDEVIEELKE